MDSEKALMLLIEEITTGLPGYDSYTTVLDNDTREAVREKVQAAAK